MISTEHKQEMLSQVESPLSMRSKCVLLSLNRSSQYYTRKTDESDLNLELMVHMDKMYTDHPEYGAERMHTWLTMDLGYVVNIKRINRLYYEVMGLKSLMPGPHTSRISPEHKKYPYLLRHLPITAPNQVWMADITYIPMSKGYMYLIAFIDVFSRKILHWDLSNSMSSIWCCNVLEDCIEKHGRPTIINTDQGSQFTSDDFVYRVINNGIKLSMDGQGRAKDNIYIERFWRTIKYEHIYIRPSQDAEQLRKGIGWYIDWYNAQRRHTELNNNTPNTVFNSYHEPVKSAA